MTILHRSNVSIQKHVWNSLPDKVVAAETVDTFKNRLDLFWKDQEIKFNWKSELSGTGSRTVKI